MSVYGGGEENRNRQSEKIGMCGECYVVKSGENGGVWSGTGCSWRGGDLRTLVSVIGDLGVVKLGYSGILGGNCEEMGGV
ncbi:MAG: hypothetical protein ACKPHU_06520 [Planctomycetaceae bacterium]